VLDLDALFMDRDDHSDAVAITFDDGFLNAAGPLEALRAHDLPVTLFVVSRHAGRTNAWAGQSDAGIPTLPLLDWPRLEHLVTRGVAIGAHTRRHPPLTRVSAARLDDELGGAADDLASRLGARPWHVAYPYGDVDATVTACAARYYRFGYTTRLGPLTGSSIAMQIPRLDMYYFQRPGLVEGWGTIAFGLYLTSFRIRRMLRRTLLGSALPEVERDAPAERQRPG
jgi:peptidoglycan/xylan/chitin deacetylase (PgdA/CDA1 family)